MNQVHNEMDLKPILMGEILMLEMLGRLLYEPLNQEWLSSMITEEVFEDVPFGADQKITQEGLQVLNQWTQDHQQGLDDAGFDDLRADYMRLFIGVGKVLAPLWESVHFSQQRLVFQEITLDVRNWYRRFGLEPENLHKEPDDHIGLELIFAAQLSRHALQALEDQKPDLFQRYLEAHNEFLNQHLLRWAPYWASLVEEHARTDFYRGLALLTKGALLEIAEQYGLEIDEEIIK